MRAVCSSVQCAALLAAGVHLATRLDVTLLAEGGQFEEDDISARHLLLQFAPFQVLPCRRNNSDNFIVHP